VDADADPQVDDADDDALAGGRGSARSGWPVGASEGTRRSTVPEAGSTRSRSVTYTNLRV
jgi:hypothetical protein